MKKLLLLLISIPLLFSCGSGEGSKQNDKVIQDNLLITFKDTNIVDFFNLMYEQHKNTIESKYKEEYVLFCEENNLINFNTVNKETFYKLYFLNQLFTTNSTVDCANEGILEIPYFWATSRKEIVVRGGSKMTDRTPNIFLSDLITISPKYSHAHCGEFYTFGWCAEREMSFVAILKHMGFSAKVVAQNKHAWTEMIVELYYDNASDNNDVNANYILKIDNTFNQFQILNRLSESKVVWENNTDNHPENKKCVKYEKDCEFCLMHEFYNPKSNQSLNTIIVEKDAANRINTQIHLFFE